MRANRRSLLRPRRRGFACSRARLAGHAARQLDANDRPAVGAWTNHHSAAAELDRLRRDRQPEPEAAAVTAGTREATYGTFRVGDPEATALVEDLDTHPALVADVRLHEHRFVAGMSPGIRDEVGERLFREVAIHECL